MVKAPRGRSGLRMALVLSYARRVLQGRPLYSARPYQMNQPGRGFQPRATIKTALSTPQHIPHSPSEPYNSCYSCYTHYIHYSCSPQYTHYSHYSCYSCGMVSLHRDPRVGFPSHPDQQTMEADGEQKRAVRAHPPLAMNSTHLPSIAEPLSPFGRRFLLRTP
jgi:hypothetical protein